MEHDPDPTTFDDRFRGHPAGHTVAGTFYLLWGIVWLILTYWNHFTQPRKPQKHTGILSFFSHDSNEPLSFKSWIPVPCCPRIPLEAIVKTFLAGLGIFAEMFLDFYPNEDGVVTFRGIVYQIDFDELHRHYSSLNRLFHICLYLPFLISGVVDLISVCTRLPRLTNKIFLCFAFYCEYLLFSFHIHGRDLFDSAIHSLLLYFIGACALFSTLRLFNANNLFINGGLSGSMIMQGTNLIQLGWVLFGSRKYSPYSHENPKFLAAVTTWHLLGISLLMVVLYVVMRAIFKRTGKLRDFEYETPSTINSFSMEKKQLLDEMEMEEII